MTIKLSTRGGGQQLQPPAADLRVPRLAGKSVPAAADVRARARFLTREQAAARVGKSLSTIRAWESDGLAAPGQLIREADLLEHDRRMRTGEGRPRRGRRPKSAGPTEAARIADALGFIEQTTYANEDSSPTVRWSNAEVLELLQDIAGRLRGPQEGVTE